MASASDITSRATRRIVVDDTDSQIQYSGSWFVDTTGSQDNVGNFGKTFRGSLHGVVSTLASLSFVYEGSSARIFGTLDSRIRSGSLDPTWDCFIDGKSIGIPKVIDFPENHWPLCDYQSDSPGEYNLSLRVISQQRHFWLDYIDYVPTPTASTQNSFVEIRNHDPALQYDASWAPAGEMNFARFTTTPGGSMRTTFIGTGLEWYGWIPKEMKHESSLGTFTVDGGDTSSFVLNGLRPGDATQYNQMFFQTPELPFGPHTISVTYTGSNTPLSLQYLIVLNQTSGTGAQTTNIPIAPTDTPIAPVQATSSSQPKAGTIVGAVLGTLIAITLLIIAFIYGRRWHRKRNRPTIQPLPGYVPSREPRAPLDFDTIPTRYSVELEERHHSHQLSPFHIRRRSRVFNPDVRSTITSLDLNPPPVHHAAPSTSNPETDSILSVPPDTTDAFRARDPQTDPYSAGYPYANMDASNYQQLVAATKAEEARTKSMERNHQFDYA